MCKIYLYYRHIVIKFVIVYSTEFSTRMIIYAPWAHNKIQLAFSGRLDSLSKKKRKA